MHPTTHGPRIESLESRTLFSTSLVLRPGIDAAHAARALVTFNQSYRSDIHTILFASGTTPAAQRPAFDAAVGTALNTLNATIDSDISDLPARATLATTIQGDLLGSPSTTLQSKLAALTTPTGPGTASARMFQSQSQVDIVKTGFAVGKAILTSPTGAISPGTLLGDLGKVASDFLTFAKTYDSDAKSILFASDQPSANRPAFDSAIGTALGTLNSSVDAAISNLPASVSSSLDPEIQAALMGSGSDSLQSKLAASSTPPTNGFFATLALSIVSKIKIASSGVQVAGDIGSAVHQFNTAG